MIGRLHGKLLEKQPPLLVVDVQGVGYELEAPMSTFYHLPELGAEVKLFTHLVVRADVHLLYGFYSESERRLFRTLIKVSGVGPKLALAILSGMEGEMFVRCIQQADIALLTRLPGVGKKTAERLVLEMRDRLQKGGGISPLPAGSRKITITSAVEDAISALIALGYKPQEASRLVHSVEEPQLSSEMLIRKALQAAL